MAASARDPKLGWAEALRRSMQALIASGGRFAHPANWAPFVVVGEGAETGRFFRKWSIPLIKSAMSRTRLLIGAS